MKELKNIKIIFVMFLFFLFNLKSVHAILPLSNELHVPIFIQFFLLVNVLQLSVAIVMVSELKKISISKVWDTLNKGNLFALLHTIIIAVLIKKIYLGSSSNVILLIPFFYSIAVTADLISQYLIAKPLIKVKINLTRLEHLLFYLFTLIISWTILNKFSPFLDFPSFPNFKILYLYVSFFILIDAYIVYSSFYISKSYEKIGFLYKPYYSAWIGLSSLGIFGILTFYVELNNLFSDYYYVFLWLISVTFAVVYYLQFVIEYPSLLERKWKAMMPFDLVKVATALTLAFLTTSLYFTVKEYPTFVIYQNVLYAPLLLLLLVVFAAIMPIFAYTKAIAEKTKIRYWGYLKSGLLIHLVATFYVFALIALLWDGLASSGKLLSALFGLSAFAFYLLYALDMRSITTDLDIKFAFNKLDIARYTVSLYSLFFLIFLSISFTYQKTFKILGSFSLESYPIILFFIAVFLIAFTTYLSVTHKGFEELMKKNIWSELSYLSSFAAFIVVYFIYTSLKTEVQSFPLRNLFFIGYFAVLTIEMYSIKTLGIRVHKREKKDVVDILNSSARHFLRTDYLEKIWEETVDKYATLENKLESARFSPSSRTFYLQDLDERTRIVASVAILLNMHRISTESDKVTPASTYPYDTLKRDIEEVLGEKILMLPGDLRANFDEEKYYPLLYGKMINNLIDEVKAFIPATEHKIIFDRLARVNPFFRGIVFEGSRMKVPEGSSFSHEEFINYFKLYLNTVEKSFPFEHTLLYKPVKDLTKEELVLYNFSLVDLIDLVPTGFEKIDEITDGGLVKNTSTLLVTEETKTKNEILSSFIGQGIKDNDSIVYATSQQSSQEVWNAMLRDFGEVKNTTVIDLYQAMHAPAMTSEIIEDGDRAIIPINTTLFQHSIVKAIKKYPRDAHKRVVLNVYNDLQKYYRWEELFVILSRQVEGFRKWNCTSIVTLDSTLISKDDLEEVKKRFDSVIILLGKGKEVSMVVSKLYGGTPVYRVISLHE